MLREQEIVAEAQALSLAYENGYSPPEIRGNSKMLDAIEACIEAEARIEEFAATVPAATDPNNQTEVDAIEWKRDQIRFQIRRCARAARDRKAHLATLRTTEDWQKEKRRCRAGLAGTKHWFRYWAWALDPRLVELPVQPFVPFGLYEDDKETFQWEYITWLHDTTFIKRKSGLVEKARDMGATLGWLLWATCNFLFRDGFTALLTSANEDLVDSKQDPDTLFEKVRFVLRLQPTELLPEGFSIKHHLTYMNIANPENGSVLSGKAPTENVGRQLRRTCVLKDESAAWPQNGRPQSTSLSQTSNSIFDVSSVKGKLNYFHDKAHEPDCNKFVMDWREHPWKDQRWYNALPYGYVTEMMSSEAIAQEVDRNYDASQPGKVFKGWNEPYTCIEWSEMLAYFAKCGLYDRFIAIDGTKQIPADWNWARMQDKGETKHHPRITLYCAVPGKTWPAEVRDSIFFFIEHQAGTGDDLGTVVTELTAAQRKLNINPPREPQLSLNSHEAKKEREVYLDEYGWFWQSWDTDYDSGISNIRIWLSLIDTHKPNPFRPMLNGRSRIYLVCADGQASLFFHAKDGKPQVTPAKDHEGFIRLRAEMPSYHYPAAELGKPVKDQRPLAFFDDAIVCVRAIAVHWGPDPKAMTEEEKILRRMHPSIRPGAAAQYAPHTPEHDQIILSQQIWGQEFQQEMKERVTTGPVNVNRRTPSSFPRTQR
jgi:hypothetical protein